MRHLEQEDLDRLKTEFLALDSEKAIADFLSLSVSRLRFFLYIQSDSMKYKEFVLKKRRGGERRICAPNSYLKVIQQQINIALYEVYKPRACVKGFVKNLSIKDNAVVHHKRRYLLNIDLADFFDSINFGRVRGLFLARPFSFNPKVATILAQLCCHKNSTPQGAPTSPIISNIICSRLDKQLQDYARTNNLLYTRYADDMTFSTNLTTFPENVAKKIDDVIRIGEGLTAIIENNGFKVNQLKTKLLSRYNRQEVTGLVVNKFVNVKRSYVRNLRAMIHSWRKLGYQEASTVFLNKYDYRNRNPEREPPEFRRVVKGKLRFLCDILGNDNKIYLNLLGMAKRASPGDFNVPLNRLEELAIVYRDLKNLRYNSMEISEVERGFYLESLLNEVFKIFEIPVIESFKRDTNGEQIDGAFKYGGHYLLECKWKKKLTDHSETDAFHGKIRRAGGKVLMGLFFSVNGFTKKLTDHLKQDTEKSIFLMTGEDLEDILNQKYTLTELLQYKIDMFILKGDPLVKYTKG